MEKTSLPAVSIKGHAAVLLPVLLLLALLYAPVMSTYYCGFDDMLELHRVAFLDEPDAWSDFTTVLNNSFKYRPISLLMNRWTFEWSGASPVAFRARNTGFHLANAAMLYGIAFLLFRSRKVAGIGAALFGAHPFVNQSVVGGLWTVTPCDFLFLFALLAFMIAVAKRGSLAWLVVSMVAATLGLLGYDAVMPVFGLIFVYLALVRLAGEWRAIPRRFLVTLVVLTLAGNALYFSLRAKNLPPGRPQPVAITTMVKNVAIYTGTLWMAADPVLLNQVLDTPLPREIVAGARPPALWWLLTLGPVVAAMLLLFLRARRTVARLKTIEWGGAAFCAVGIVASYSPFVVFNDHASETYIYLPLAFSMTLLSRLLNLFLGARTLAVVLVCLLSSHAWATAARTQRVAECGRAVRTIFKQLPPELKDGTWQVYLANNPAQPQSRPYGMYGYQGVHVLGFGDYGAPGLEAGLRFATGNRNISASEVDFAGLAGLCAPGAGSRTMCLLVDADGAVHQ